MKTVLILTNLLLIAFFSQAQNQVTGKLLDPLTKAGVGFVSAGLYHQKDSTLVVGTQTDDAGVFVFNKLKKGKYYVKFAFLGYKPLIKSDVVISNDTEKIDLGNLELQSQDQALGEVKIEAERLKGVEQVDRTVYAINDMAKKASNSGLDLLKKIPSVQVDLQNNISLEGSSNILIFVDGKKRDKEYMSQIDPSTIDKVEIINNPSSKYEADVTGVINIILKRDRNMGVSGRIELEVPTSSSAISSSSAGLDYSYKKFHFFGSAFSHYEQFRISEKLTRDSWENGTSSHLNQNGDGNIFVKIASIDYGFDYFINDKNTLNFYANYNPYQFIFSHDFIKQQFNGNKLEQYNTTGSRNNDNNLGNNYSLFYKKKFDKPSQELTSEISFYTYNGTQENNNNDQYYHVADMSLNGALIERYNKSHSDRQSLSGKVDYTQDLNGIRMETGLQASEQWLSSNYFDQVNQVRNPSSNEFKYRETRSSGYLNFSGKLKWINWQLGARLENSDIEINDSEHNNYFCFLPSLNLQHKFSDSKNIKFTYRRSITRPNSSDLNPFEVVIDSLNISKGNPKLEPYYTNKFQLTYNQNFGNNFISPFIYADYYSNYFQNIQTKISGNRFKSTTDNVAKGFDYGAGLSAGLQPFKWWNLNLYGKLYQIRVQMDNNASLYEIEETQKVSWQANLTSVMTFFKNMSIIAYAQYNSPQLSAQTTSSRSALYLLGVEKGMFKDKAKIGVYYYLPFADKFVFKETETTGADFHSLDTNTIYAQNLISVKFTYNFSNGKQVKKLDRQKTNMDEGKKMGF